MTDWQLVQARINPSSCANERQLVILRERSESQDPGTTSRCGDTEHSQMCSFYALDAATNAQYDDDVVTSRQYG